MCGIHAVVSPHTPAPLETKVERLLQRRGPDHTGNVTQHLADLSLTASFTSTVLSLRGDHVAEQPLVDPDTGSVLCWNGEAWRIHGQAVCQNDTEAVLSLLVAASLKRQDGQHDMSLDPVLEALQDIEGPFSFIYYDKLAKRLYYGRDRLGRRSLLLSNGSSFMLSSVAEALSSDWVEVEADGCYAIQLDQAASPNAFTPIRYPWNPDDAMVSSIGYFNTSLPTEPCQLSQESRPVCELRKQLTESLNLRVLDVPIPPHSSSSDARVAVLFSGGLDCTVLARLASDAVPAEQPIDLLNVAFENPRVASNLKLQSVEDLYELCPDRITGRKAFSELVECCPTRTWRFVTINVPYKEYCAHRSEVISLMFPHNTEMDLSIASALYFASRGQGSATVVPGQADPQPYTTTARVLLSGLGADELFGGYQRHSVAYVQRGYQGLVEELKLDVSRLGKRNLGRDDRVLSHWGREARFPYLDERLVRWAIELPAWEKCNFDVPGSDSYLDPEKRVLRLLARSLGLRSVAGEKKRAIQFGARTAKMENGRVKGTTSITI
ncbi:unnamed protein product [Clonostachys byssicola]|uniref:Glutamine amidotransferase type-2 domain-containing protein n=1 Tax=Clonostachys byssicola TaxID=160290 RepID=A0A9N9U0A6_9HYPO|nr:unnamed protein product [Clonostachys byssicola]